MQLRPVTLKFSKNNADLHFLSYRPPQYFNRVTASVHKAVKYMLLSFNEVRDT